jgi:hypothetical protein
MACSTIYIFVEHATCSTKLQVVEHRRKPQLDTTLPMAPVVAPGAVIIPMTALPENMIELSDLLPVIRRDDVPAIWA